MGNEIEELSIARINGNDKNTIQNPVAREFSLTIVFNNQELITLLCSPTKWEYLTLGFLQSAGLIEEKNDIKKVIVDEQTEMAMVETKTTRPPQRQILFEIPYKFFP